MQSQPSQVSYPTDRVLVLLTGPGAAAVAAAATEVYGLDVSCVSLTDHCQTRPGIAAAEVCATIAQTVRHSPLNRHGITLLHSLPADVPAGAVTAAGLVLEDCVDEQPHRQAIYIYESARRALDRGEALAWHQKRGGA